MSGSTLAAVAALVVLVAVPLGIGSRNVAADGRLAAQAQPVAESWARANGWQVTTVTALNGVVVVTALGPPPQVDPGQLRIALNSAGLADADLTIRLVVGGTRSCPAGGTACAAVAPVAS